MFPFGGYYWSNSQHCDNGTQEEIQRQNCPMEPYDPYPKAPTRDCIESFTNHMLVQENQAMLQLQLNVLLEKISKEMGNLHPLRGQAIPEQIVNTIFVVCQLLQVSDNIKYLALEIYDRFMLQMNDQLKTHIQIRRPGPSYVTNVEQRSRDFAMLRIGTCVQLASKSYAFGEYRNHVGIAELKNVLQQFHCNYTSDVFTKSEIRILEMAKYSLNLTTAFDVIELVLIRLELNPSDYRRVYTKSIQCLDYLYQKRQLIFNDFYTSTNRRNRSIDRKKFRETVEFNKFVDGCAVITSSLLLLRMDEYPALKLLEKLAAQIVKDHLIVDLAAAIVNRIICIKQAGPPLKISRKEGLASSML